MIYFLVILYLLGIEGHASEWSHYNHHRWMAAVWPLFAAISALCTILSPAYWLWTKRPRWRWRKTWVREVSLKHYGWTTKEGKLCGVIKVDKIFGDAEKDKWVFCGLTSGFGEGDWAIGTVTRPEYARAK